MNYAKLVHDLLQCSRGYCIHCSHKNEYDCANILKQTAASAIQNLSCEVSCEVLKIPCEISASDAQ